MEFYPQGTFSSIQEYNTYCSKFNNNWSLKKESIKYCLLDCKSLLEVLLKFNTLIYQEFNTDASKMPTLPSISFKVFRKNFFQNCKNLIPKYKLIDFLHIKEAYTGGATELYKSTNLNLLTQEIKEKLYLYDFNALFAYILMHAKLPCGQVRSFIGVQYCIEI